MEKREDGNDSAPSNNRQHQDALPINVKPEARLKAALLCRPENTKLQFCRMKNRPKKKKKPAAVAVFPAQYQIKS